MSATRLIWTVSVSPDLAAQLGRVERAVVGATVGTLRDTGHQIALQVESTSAYDTGFMSEHVSEIPHEDGLGVDVGWLDEVFIEESPSHFPYFYPVELGSETQAAQPSLEPAFREQTAKLPKALDVNITAALLTLQRRVG